VIFRIPEDEQSPKTQYFRTLCMCEGCEFVAEELNSEGTEDTHFGGEGQMEDSLSSGDYHSVCNPEVVTQQMMSLLMIMQQKKPRDTEQTADNSAYVVPVEARIGIREEWASVSL
jgi:hypothetical protein